MNLEIREKIKLVKNALKENLQLQLILTELEDKIVSENMITKSTEQLLNKKLLKLQKDLENATRTRSNSPLGRKADEVGSAADNLVKSDDAPGTKATSVARAVSQLLGEASKSGASTHVLQSAMNVADTAGKLIAAKRSKNSTDFAHKALKADIKSLHEALDQPSTRKQTGGTQLINKIKYMKKDFDIY